MNNGELSLMDNMESEILQGMNSPLHQDRLNSISMAANSATPSEVETENVKTGVSQAIKKLDLETRDMFPEKEEVAEAMNNGEEVKEVAKTIDAKTEKTIMGMKPLTFGLVVLAVAAGGYFAYKHFNKK